MTQRIPDTRAVKVVVRRATYSCLLESRCSSLLCFCVISLFLFARAFAGEYGVLTYRDEGTSIAIVDCADDAAGLVIIPDSIEGKPVTSVGGFFGCTQVSRISIPATVTRIEGGAFGACENLDDVILPSGVDKIEENTFAGCSALTNVFLPSGLKSIGRRAFASCPFLKNTSGNSKFVIPNSVTTIGIRAFGDCLRLAEVSIPSSVNQISEGAFEGCISLKSINIPSSVSQIERETFYASGISKVRLPGSIRYIGFAAFGLCPLERFEFPSGMEVISLSALGPGLHSIKSLTIPAGATSVSGSLGGQNLSTLIALCPFESFEFNSIPQANQVYVATDFSEYRGIFPPVLNPDGTVLRERVVLISNATQVKSWIASFNLPVDAALNSDSDHDGLPLLTEYSLDLDPTTPSVGQTTPIELSGGFMKMNFFAGAQGVEYVVESSSDLVNWTTNGIVIDSSPDGWSRSAAIEATGSRQWLRLRLND